MKTYNEIKEMCASLQNTVGLREAGAEKIRVVVGMATCGLASGAGPVMDELKKAVAELGLSNVELVPTGCIGICQFEPIVEVMAPGEKKVTYVKMTPDKAREVVEKHLKGGKALGKYTLTCVDTEDELDDDAPVTYLEDVPFFAKQLRIALHNCGIIDPENIDEYIARGGYQALGKALTEMTPDGVIDVISASGLRGRGGAGFPTGTKWKFACANRGQVQKYVCCNADEGDPGAFMDRSLLEGDPHAILEAMAIAGYAIGADQGYIYVRAEYPLAVAHLQTAIEQAHEYGLLGKNIYGTGFNFDIGLRLGAGAFVCGEETALMTSIEGKRGEPRPRPPFPAVKGLFGKPSILNNVETYANIAQIICNGADWFQTIGSEKSKGTKVFAMGGQINRAGLVEVPMGMTLREIVEEIGGGIPNGRRFKAAQTGGPSGGCITVKNFDVPIDYENLAAIGSMMGSGGLIVMDETSCMVDIAKFFLGFTVDESCGKCTPCRIGTKRMLEKLDKITDGKATMEDLDELEDLAAFISKNSLCGLGQTSPNPILSTIQNFREEYEAHITEKRCPAGVCRALLNYVIDPDLCIGCGMCAKNCPADAIEKTAYIPAGHKLPSMAIDTSKCIKCGACIDNCKFGAISKK